MSDEPHLLTVNQNERNNELLSEFLESEGYRVSCAHTIDEVDDAIETATFDVSLFDVDGFPPAVWARCEDLRSTRTPLLVISLQPQRAERTSDDADVSRIFEKPIGKQRLLDLIRQLV